MRTWTNPQARPRYSSLVSCSCQYINSTLPKALNHGSPFKGIPFDQQIASGHSRAFSNTASARIILEDDDDLLEVKAPNESATKPFISAARMPAKDMRSLIASRPKNSKIKKIDPKKVRRLWERFDGLPDLREEYFALHHTIIDEHRREMRKRHMNFMGKCQSIHNDFSRLIEERKQLSSELTEIEQQISDTRVARIEDQLLKSQAAFDLLVREYCDIEFPHTPLMENKLQKISQDIKLLRLRFVRIDVRRIQLDVEDSQNLIAKFRQTLHREYLAPRKSARAKIDTLLGYRTTFDKNYEICRSMGRTVLDGMLDIVNLCHQLDLLNPRYKMLSKIPRDLMNNFSGASHAYRAALRLSMDVKNPLRNSNTWSYNDMLFLSGNRLPPDIIMESLALDDKAHQKARKALFKRERVALQYLQRSYLRKWNGPEDAQSAKLNKSWRQLDVMAPIWLNHMYYLYLNRELWYLINTLRGRHGPLWETVPSSTRGEFAIAIEDCVLRMQDHRATFQTLYTQYQDINWTRLRLEEKLLRLGEPSMIQEEGLFVAPNPLSQNHALFQAWTVKIAHLGMKSWYTHNINLTAVKPGRSKDWEKFHLRLSSQFHELQLQKLHQQSLTVPELGTTKPNSRQRRRAKQKRIAPIANITSKTKGKRQRFKKSGIPVLLLASSDKPVGRRRYSVEPRRKMTAESLTENSSNDILALWRRKWTEERNVKTFGRRSFSTACVYSREPFPKSSIALGGSLSTEDPDASQRISKPVATSINETLDKVAESSFWSHNSQRRPDGQKLVVHYCRTLQSTEEVAKLFLDSRVIGFDMEWKAQASASHSIQENLSMIQLANEERIALFHIAMFKPARNLQDLVAPSLQRVLEAPHITKVGVAIKGDSTRLRKYLGIKNQSIFELSHLFKLVKYGENNPKLVNKRNVNLNDQMKEHFGLPLDKSEDVRCSDWHRPLNYLQVQYAATDPYAGLCLFNIMEQKRLAMKPVPPRPAHAELNLPIVLPQSGMNITEDKGGSLV